MNEHDDIDRILSEEPVIRPRAGFAAAVMREVRLEAEPRTEPLRFPWHRFLPGFLTAVSLCMTTFVLVGWAAEADVEVPAVSRLARFVVSPMAADLSIAAAALGGSLLLGWMAVRYGSRRVRY